MQIIPLSVPGVFSRLLKKSRKWPKNPIVMLSEAKHLLCFDRQKKQVLRFAQDDNSSSRTIRGVFQQPVRPVTCEQGATA